MSMLSCSGLKLHSFYGLCLRAAIILTLNQGADLILSGGCAAGSVDAAVAEPATADPGAITVPPSAADLPVEEVIRELSELLSKPSSTAASRRTTYQGSVRRGSSDGSVKAVTDGALPSPHILQGQKSVTIRPDELLPNGRQASSTIECPSYH